MNSEQSALTEARAATLGKPALVMELRRILPADAVLYDAEDLHPYECDALATGGHASLFRPCALKADTFQLPDEGVMQLQRRLNQAPLGIFSPGRLYPDL